MAKPWDANAATAKRIAKDIITGEEENKEGVRLIHVVDRLDTFATDTLNKKYAQYGSQASIHTYNGGRQIIDTHHTDGTVGHFDSNGNNAPTDNAMDIEVENYINNNLDESKIYKNMKKNVKRIDESQLRAIIAESVKKVLNEMDRTPAQTQKKALNEFQAGGNDWGQTYSDYRQRNQTNAELDDVVTNLHTICQYMEDISNAVYNGQPSRYFPKCQPEYLQQAYELIEPIYGLMANRTNRRGDAQGMNANEIKQECGQSLKQLSQMQYLGVICNAARRACQELAI